MSSPPIEVPYHPEFAGALLRAGLSIVMAERVALLAAQVHIYATEKTSRYPQCRRQNGHIYVSVRFKDWLQVFPGWASGSRQAGNVVRHVVNAGVKVGVLDTATHMYDGLWYRCGYLRIYEICRTRHSWTAARALVRVRIPSARARFRRRCH